MSHSALSKKYQCEWGLMLRDSHVFSHVKVMAHTMGMKGVSLLTSDLMPLPKYADSHVMSCPGSRWQSIGGIWHILLCPEGDGSKIREKVGVKMIHALTSDRGM